MIQYIKKLTAFSLAVVVLSIPFAATAAAQTGSIGGKPTNPRSDNPRTKSIFVETIEPGQSRDNAVTVINNTTETKNVQLYAVDAVSSSGGAFACAQAADKSSGVGTWIKLSQSSIALAGGEKQDVPFTISVPANAEPGEQNGCVVMQAAKDTTFKEGIGISFRTAIRVAILVPGEIRKGLTLNPLTINRDNNKLILQPSVKNTGNVSLDATIKPALKTVFGTTVSTQNNTFPVLRDQTADWNFEFDKPFWGGIYKATYAVAYDASNNGVIGAQTNQAPTEVTGPSKWVFVIPSLPALAVELLLAAVVLAGVATVLRRRQHNNAVQRSWGTHTVKKDEQLADIAKDHGTTWKALARANKLKAPYHVKPGQSIKVPKNTPKKK